MRGEQLSYKVFWVTLVGLLLFIVVWLLLQTNFFGTFYTYQKTKDWTRQFEAIYAKYADGRYELNEKPREVLEFEQRFYGLTAAMYRQGNRIDIYTGGYLAMSVVPVYPSMQLPAYEINVHNRYSSTVPSSPENAGNRAAIPSASTNFADTYSNRMATILHFWLQDNDRFASISQEGQVIVTKMKSPYDASENLLLAAVKLPNAVNHTGGDAYLIALATLQPIGDAVRVMSQFYAFLYVLAVLLVLMFAYIFSRTIAHPLVQLNNAAKRLATLDFTAPVQIDRKDEIGQLAGTMNRMALNLRQTMDELQEANVKLLADIEKEKQLEQLRKQFVASVSHELKTPVSLVQGYAEALKDNVGHGMKRDKYAGIIMEESERMARLVSDLLDLSQLESGRFALHWADVPVQETVRSVLGKMAPLLNDKDIRLRLAGIDGDEIWVRSDRQRLEQVLMNLLGNAIRHVPAQGRVELRVTTGPDAVSIEVFNEGLPIPEQHLPYIWDTFYRADRSGSREYGGTGIGLSIVKAILLRHGSHFGVSNDDGGVRFTFTLPLKSAGR
ncbi:sensor histidine kinase [Paenibacillus solanacearum]|nr:HAMP domain-containing sensor histidine kinase [Paenibacillus solanacearum]